MTVSILLADDQPLIRAGIAMLLRAEPELEVVGEASDGAEAVALAQALLPDVVLMDVRMPGMDGITATRLLTEVGQDPDRLTKVLVLTTFSDGEVVHGALCAGASGFLLKHAAPETLIAAVREVGGGGWWIDQAVAGTVIAALGTAPGAGQSSDEAVARLTPREREVLFLVAQGMSNGEIARSLVLSEATVKTHVSRILMKTDSHDRAQAVVLAYQSGLVVVPPASRPRPS
ncbi:response regulator [Cellulomonas sp. URHB0016]